MYSVTLGGLFCNLSGTNKWTIHGKYNQKKCTKSVKYQHKKHNQAIRGHINSTSTFSSFLFGWFCWFVFFFSTLKTINPAIVCGVKTIRPEAVQFIVGLPYLPRA